MDGKEPDARIYIAAIVLLIVVLLLLMFIDPGLGIGIQTNIIREL